jgi:outer membrane protein assembly factor BamB/predicted phosphodiesterase
MSLRFAMVSDTHVGMTAASVERLRPVYAAIARRAPDFVLHCGDITDTGLPGEYERYWQTVPAVLRGRIRHVPGNHEVRWDSTAKGLYREQFGAVPYSFDTGGVHFTGFDPTQPLLEPGHCGAAALEWLDRDLAAAGGPTLLFQHFPVAGEHDYVDDQAALIALIALHDVRVLVAGHVHRETVTRLDGPVQVTLQAVLKEPVFYWAELGGGPALTISRVTVAADGTQAGSPVAAVPLTGPLTWPRPGHRPARGAAVGVPGAWPPEADPAAATATDSAAGLPRPQWRLRLPGSVQAGIAVAGSVRAGIAAAGDVVADDSVPDDSVACGGVAGGGVACGGVSDGVMAGGGVGGEVAVAASTSGDVAAVRVPAGRGDRDVSWLWRARFGPVYRRPGVSRDGRTLFVPSADGHLYALDASTGLVGWRFAADAPVLSQPLVTSELVVFTAGERLLAVHAASGELAWAVPGRGFSAGRAGCDGERAYTAAADGFARAHDLRTGREAWSHRMVSGDLHRVTLYSGWDDVIALGGGVALAATVSGTQALEAATGAPRWSLPGSTMYPPTVVLGDGTALLTTERGLLSRVRLADGGTVWQADLGVSVQNAGLTVAGGSAWVVSADGRLVRVRLADGRKQGSVRYTLAQCFSAPAVAGDTLVVGDQNGVVHGLRLPPGPAPYG